MFIPFVDKKYINLYFVNMLTECALVPQGHFSFISEFKYLELTICKTTKQSWYVLLKVFYISEKKRHFPKF